MDAPEFTALSRHAAGVALLLFGGWVVMVFLRAFFDAYTPRPTATGPTEEEAAPAEDQIPSRLATVLPALRGVVLGAVAGLIALVVLSRLGVISARCWPPSASSASPFPLDRGRSSATSSRASSS